MAAEGDEALLGQFEAQFKSLAAEHERVKADLERLQTENGELSEFDGAGAHDVAAAWRAAVPMYRRPRAMSHVHRDAAAEHGGRVRAQREGGCGQARCGSRGGGWRGDGLIARWRCCPCHLGNS